MTNVNEGNAQVVIDIVQDLGAKGDGNPQNSVANTEAFIKAGMILSNLPAGQTGELIIPSTYTDPITNQTMVAEYILGMQLATNAPTYSVTATYGNYSGIRQFSAGTSILSGLDGGMLRLSNTTNSILIHCDNPQYPPTIKFKNSLLFGTFLKPNQSYEKLDALANLLYSFTNTTQNIIHIPEAGWQWPILDQNTRCWIGHFIQIESASNIIIEDIIINGNNSNFIWGGIYQDRGIQLPHTGIFCNDATNITCNNVDVREMGYDGMEVRGNSNLINITNCNFLTNLRQGLSWTGGSNLTATKCHFNETGKISTPGFNPTLSNPGAGLDLEPDTYIDHGNFIECEFINNNGPAISNAEHVAANTDYMSFDECTMYSKNLVGMRCTGKNFKFNKCNIYARVSWSSIGNIATEAMQYKLCTFEDLPYNNTEYWLDDKPLIEIPGLGTNLPTPMNYTLFDECTFKVHDKNREFFYLNWSTAGMQASEWSIIKDCEFIYENEGTPFPNASLMRGVCFRGINKIENTLNGVNAHHMITTHEAMLEGSDNECEPNELEFVGQVEHHMLSLGSDIFTIGKKLDLVSDGYARYLLNNKSYAGVTTGTVVNIGPGSSLHILKGGSIGGAGDYEVEGAMIADAGSYVDLVTATFNSTIPNSNTLFYFDKECNRNATTFSPLWCNGIGYGTGLANLISHIDNWLDGYIYDPTPSPTCVQGGHNYFPNSLQCSLLYTNVISSNSMNLLYNKTISCYGYGGNSSFDADVRGASGTYTITASTMNGSTIINPGTVYTNLGIGQVTLTVTDANCTETFFVKLDTTLEYQITKGCASANDPAIISCNACSATINGPGIVTTQPNNLWHISSAGTYTITATGADNSPVSRTLYIGDCSACAAAPDEAEWYAPSTPTTAISPDGILAQKAIVLQGNVQVDNEWFIYNHNVNANNVNTNVFLTAGASLDIDPDMAIVINRSKLQGCFDYWNGIFTSGAGERVIVNNQSTVQDMQTGIFIMNNAFLQARNSYFTNNQTSLHFYNSLNPDPESFIYSNHFSGNASMFSNANGNRPGCGIKLWQVGDFEIGSNTDAALGNSFENMSNGIYIKQTQSGGVSSRIGIYNNKFTNITHHLTDYDKMSSCFTGPLGAAIYSDADASSLIQSHLDVQSDASVSTPGFQNCDKAVVTLGSGLTAKNLKTDNCLLGIMCYSIYNRPFEIVSNQILNAHMGIKLSGLMLNATISGNEMLLSKTIFSPASIILAPIGIRYQISSDPLAIQPHNISGNNIIINRIAGIGILNGNADSRLTENGNTTSFSTNNTASANGYNIRSLTGYWNENNWRSLYVQNTTNGITNAAVWPLRNSMGMYMNQSPNCVLDCNRLKFTRYGFYVWGKNNTNEKNVTYNKCNANEIPWFFLDNNSAGSGTFGDVGGNNDNGNEFISTTNPVDWRGVAGINTGTYKVLRNGSGTFLSKIYTDPSLLDQTESGPLFSGYEYFVQQPNVSGYTDPCVDNENNTPDYIAEAIMDSSELNYNMAIINDTVQYINYPEVGRWIDKYRLYSELDADSIMLNSKPEYLYFYSDNANQTIGDIRAAARLIALLYDTSTNAGNDSARYAAALAANVLISSANSWEMNEKVVNDVLLYMYYNAVDSIPAQMQQDIQALASSCPFVEGTAVYRARSLWMLWEPDAIFDDRLLCMQGQNKNQDNSNMNIDSLIENEIIAATAKMSDNQTVINSHSIKKGITGNETEIKIFPNPAQNFIIVEYHCDSDGEIILYNTLGQEVMKTTLIKGRGKVQIQINDIANGVYQYKCRFDKCTEEIGKLIIQK